MRKLETTFFLSIYVSLLCACGGGGDQGSDVPIGASTSTGTSAPNQNFQPITSVAAPNYSDAIRQQAFFRLNEIRRQVGLGLLGQNLLVDQAAQNHAAYLIANGDSGHTESRGFPLFSGVSSMERIGATGYSVSGSTEVISYDGRATGAQIIDGFVATAYHRIPLLDYRWTDVGMAWQVAFPGSYIRPFVFDFAYGIKGRQGAPNTAYVVWPQPGAQTSSVEMPYEVPSPSPSKLTGYGYPVSIQIDPEKILKVTKFELKELGGAPVPSFLLTFDTDPNLVTLDVRYFAALAPKDPLKHVTSYSVAFEGTVDGQPLVLNWNFTTP